MNVKLQIISPEKTAITHGTSATAKMIVEGKYKEVLDFGCGKLRNYFFMKNNGICVYGYDTESQITNIKKKYPNENISYVLPERTYETILCSFVLNVLVPDIRETVVKQLYDCLSKNGELFIEVRSNDDLKSLKNKENYYDGYLTSKNTITTFQKGFTATELKNYLISFGFKIKDIKTRKNSVICVATK